MRKNLKIISVCCFALFIVVAFGLPFFSFEGYSILRNTTSHLAAQGSPFGWLMNIVFFCLGVTAIITAYATKVRYHQVIGGIFGLSLALTSFFPHAPLVKGVPLNLFQDQAHSILASITGFSFTLLAAGHGFMSRGRQRVWGFILAAIAVLVSLGMVTFPAFMGLLQRFMFVSAFAWMFFYMAPPPQNQIRGE